MNVVVKIFSFSIPTEVPLAKVRHHSSCLPQHVFRTHDNCARGVLPLIAAMRIDELCAEISFRALLPETQIEAAEVRLEIERLL